MEEILKVIYCNFLTTEEESSAAMKIIGEKETEIDEALNELEEVLSGKLFDKFFDKITEGVSDIKEAAFIAGFAQCAKFMTNGKVDFLGTYGQKGGAVNE